MNPLTVVAWVLVIWATVLIISSIAYHVHNRKK